MQHMVFVFFFFNDTATTEIYTLSLHDALPIYSSAEVEATATVHPSASASGMIREMPGRGGSSPSATIRLKCAVLDRKSTRLNSSHANISYAVFCLKKKKTIQIFISSEETHETP